MERGSQVVVFVHSNPGEAEVFIYGGGSSKITHGANIIKPNGLTVDYNGGWRGAVCFQADQSTIHFF